MTKSLPWRAVHTRLLLLSLLALGCRRRSADEPVARPADAAAATLSNHVPAGHQEDGDEAQEALVMEAMRGNAEYPPTEEGLRSIITAYMSALGTRDAERMRHISEQMEPNQTRIELALNFDGNRALATSALTHAKERWGALSLQLAALRAPHTITLASAQGRALADGQPHGLDPRMPEIARYVRPRVRFYRVTVAGSDGARVELSPIAFVANHWTWLAEPWSWLPPGSATAGAPR